MLNIKTEETETEIGKTAKVTVSKIVFIVIAGFHRRKPDGCSVKESGFTEPETVIIKTMDIYLTESEINCKGNTTNIVAT